MPVDPMIARGVQPIEFGNTLMQIAALKQRDQAIAQSGQEFEANQQYRNALLQDQRQERQKKLDTEAMADQLADQVDSAYQQGGWEAALPLVGQWARVDPESAKLYQSLYGPKEDSLPGSYKEYQLAQKDPNYNSHLQSRRPPGTNVTVQLPPQEKAENAEVGTGFGKAYIDMQNAGANASGKINRLDRLSQLLDGVSTGKLTPTTTQIAAYAQAFGIPIDAQLDAKQAADALVKEMALQMRNPAGGAGMPGALSDKDREFLVSMNPGLEKTPQGNRLIIETHKKLAQRDKDVARLAREYRKKNGQLDEGFYTELEQWSNANPLFDGMAQSSGGVVIRFDSSGRRIP